MGKQTALYNAHVAQGARMVDFAGWDMPVNYGSQIDEHLAVRRSAGMFDVSHMAAVDIDGPQAHSFLKYLWANDVSKADAAGKALYTCMLNEAGGVVDDMIGYHLGDYRYRVVVNAGTTDKDLAWMRRQAEAFDVDIRHRDDLAIIAVQGPRARDIAAEALDEELAGQAMTLKPFFVCEADDWLIARTGYTGEDGFEIILPASAVDALWSKLRRAGVQPCGLGARDTLRLEAGLMLYGQDMDDDHHPLESGLDWTVAWAPESRDFVGRSALEKRRADGHASLVGLVLEGRGIMRSHQAVRRPGGEPEGETTSGGYSPTMERSIAFARVPAGWAGEVEVEIRNRWLPARIVDLPFVRKGKVKVAL